MVLSRGTARQPPGYCWQLFTSEARKHHGSQSAPKLLAYLIGRAGGPPLQAGGPSADGGAPNASVGGNGASPHVPPPDEGTQLRCVCQALCVVLGMCFVSACAAAWARRPVALSTRRVCLQSTMLGRLRLRVS